MRGTKINTENFSFSIDNNKRNALLFLSFSFPLNGVTLAEVLVSGYCRFLSRSFLFCFQFLVSIE